MAPLDDLPADQRAALQLLLKQGRSYDDIAQMLRIEPSAVRERARTALDTLGPDDVDGISLAEQDQVADYLLGPQSASQRAETRRFLEGSAPGRAWARVVAGELREVGGDNLPEIPAEAAEVDEAFGALSARKEHRERTERSSKVGGAVLLVGLALALLLGILALTGAFDGGGDDDGGGRAETTTAATTGTGGSPEVEAQVNLQPPEGGNSEAAGVAQIARQGGQRAVALVAQGLPAANRNRFYAIWLTRGEGDPQFLGFPNPQPTQNGRLETGFGLPENASQFEQLVVTRETQEQPRRPGTIVLRGALDLPE